MSGLMKVLSEDGADVEAWTSELDDRVVIRLYEVLVLTEAIDEQCSRLHAEGRIPFYIPTAAAAAVSAGTAAAIEDADWLYPSFRDAAAYLLRGGSVEDLIAQVMASALDATRGRQLPGHWSLPGGRFVSVSGILGTRAVQATGTAMAMKAAGAGSAVVALCGTGDLEQPSLYGALDLIQRFRAPVVIVARSAGKIDVADRAAGFAIGGRRVDGGDVLAVYKSVRSARGHAATGKGGRVVDAVLPDPPVDPAARLRPLLENRGIWDPGQEEELRQRCRARVAEAIEAAEGAGAPDPTTARADVTAAAPAVAPAEDAGR